MPVKQRERARFLRNWRDERCRAEQAGVGAAAAAVTFAAGRLVGAAIG